MNQVKLRGRLVLSGCLVINKKNELLLLLRRDHNYYETPGGKVKPEECSNPSRPSIRDLEKTAKRELFEELGGGIKISALKYFGKAEFSIPGGRLAIANKFITKIVSGEPKITEPDLFSGFKYLPIGKLESFPISPDLKLLAPKLKKHCGCL